MKNARRTDPSRLSGEAVLLAAFGARGVPAIAYAAWKNEPALQPDPVLVKRFPFTTIYQTAGNVEFVLVRAGQPSITLECKHQNVSGTTDEKLPYALLNAVYNWPSPHGVLVLSGDHWHTTRGLAVVTALRRLSALAAPASRQFDVYTQGEALNWIARTF